MTNYPFLATYQINLLAGVPYILSGGGDKIAILEATGSVNVEFVNARGGNNFRAEGVEVGMSDIGPGDIFHTLRVTSATNQSFKIAVYAGNITVTKIAGTVSVSGAGAVAVAAVTVNNAAVSLAAFRANRKSVTIYNNGANTVFLGPAGVTTADGLPLSAGGSYTVDSSQAAIFGIAAAATAENIRVIEHY